MGHIHVEPHERLVMMANQIAKAFAAQGEARAVPKIAEHIKAFWDPRMRRKIDEHVVAGGAGLEPYALTALRQLMAGAEKPVPAGEHSPFDQGSDAG
jgi:formate dehydrogenase subunit delta